MPIGEWTLEHQRNEYISDHGIIGFRGNPDQRNSDCVWFNHMPATLVKTAIGNSLWEAYFKFCVIRNPYDRAISIFYHQKTIPFRVQEIPIIFTGFDEDMNEFNAWLQNGNFASDKDKYSIDDKFCLDEVIRYENLQGDIKKICDRVEASYDPSFLPEFKKGFRPDYARTQDFYTEEGKKIVEAASKFEIDYFEYSFPDSD
jgi:hypothetical protein